MLQAVGKFNNISKELKDSIPALKGTLVFQMLNGMPNPEPDPIERQKMPMLYPKAQVRTQFKIKDSHTKELVDIVLAEGWTQDKTPTKARCFVAGIGETHFGGNFTLSEGNMEHEELYPVLWLSPERENTPCPDANVKPLFRIVNAVAESKQSNERVDTLRNALVRAKDIKEEEGRTFIASLNKDSKRDWEVLKAEIGEFAKSQPDAFLKRVDDPKTKSKATLRKAFESKIINFDIFTREVTMDGQVLCKLEDTQNFEVLEAMQSFIDTAANGSAIFEGVVKVLGKSETKQKTGSVNK